MNYLLSTQTGVIMIAVLLAGLLLAFIIFLDRRSKAHYKKQVLRAGEEEDEETETGKKRENNALVMDVKKKDFGLEHIKRTGDMGRQWNYEGQIVFWLCRAINGELSPVIPPVTLDEPPEKLFRAQSQQEVTIVYGIDVSTSQKIRYGFLAAMAIAALFLIMVMSTPKG